jgi:hypothetical protein
MVFARFLNTEAGLPDSLPDVVGVETHGRRAQVLLPVLCCVMALVSLTATAAAATTVPPRLQALEQEMGRLTVHTVRFSEVSRGYVKLTNEVNGHPVGPTRTVSLDVDVTGVVQLSPNEAELSIVRRGRAERLIAIGSLEYERVPGLARFDGGRPWVRSRSSEPANVPFASEPHELSFGGTGPYAGLINLLGTAVGSIEEVGPVIVEGVPATEFRASVQSLELIRGLPAGELERLEAIDPPTRLTLDISEAGLPLRVTASRHRVPGPNTFSSTTTTNILGTEVPVHIEAPPAKRIVGVALYERLRRQHPRALGKPEEETVTSSSKSKQ